MAKKKVLVVEDDKSMRGILAYKIASEGFEVIQAEDGDVGLKLALSQAPDLILLDLLLPKKSGLTMLDALRQDPRGKEIPVFVLTNLSENGTIYKSVSLNAAAYFIKSDNTLEHIAAEVKSKLEPETKALSHS